jgi:hypothetical protein
LDLGMKTAWLLVAVLLGAGDPPVVRVAAEGWGDAAPADIAKVLESAGAALTEHFPGRRFPPIEVSRSKDSPITLFKRGPAGELRVKLNVEDRRWAQFAFQFGHEMGHIVCGFEEYPNPNTWFEETLCEAASLFVLGRMSESWKTAPPYPNWKGYAESLKKYRDERMEKAKLPEGTGLAAWFRGREASLRKDGTQRDLNLAMAAALLPLFEEAPERWAAVATLNAVRGDAGRTFAQYLKDWSGASAEKHRPFIAKIADRFGVSIDR